MLVDSKNRNNILLVIDAYSFIFRAYYAYPCFNSLLMKININAVYGFAEMLMKTLMCFNPKYSVLVFDHGGQNFRHDIYRYYKYHRLPVPSELVLQLPLIKKVAEVLSLSTLSLKGFEADDLIASIAHKKFSRNVKKIIVSSDKDLIQLMEYNDVTLYDPLKLKYVGVHDVFKKFGVIDVSYVRDIQALVGDRADNIPGVKGIGPKSASRLIKVFGNVCNLIHSVSLIENLRYRYLLEKFKEDLILSWKLVGLRRDLYIDDIDTFYWKLDSREAFDAFIKTHGMFLLKRKFDTLFNISVVNTESYFSTVVCIKNEHQLSLLINDIKIAGYVSIFLNFATALKIYISVKSSVYLFCCSDLLNDVYVGSSLSKDLFVVKFINIFEDKTIIKVTDNLKNLFRVFKCNFVNSHELWIMDYLLGGKRLVKNLQDVISYYLKWKIDIVIEDYAFVQYFFSCFVFMKNALIKRDMFIIYQNIDLPIVYVLYVVESYGISVNAVYLKTFLQHINCKIKYLQNSIYSLVGIEFNINSFKELSKILFFRLKIPYPIENKICKNKFLTTSTILYALSIDGYKICSQILEYRRLTKIKTLYINTLLSHININTQKIHTTFLQTDTFNGRFVSVKPNLQNIPINSYENYNVRTAFVASIGCKLVSAEYSQIVLRIIAYLAHVNLFKECFQNGIDIYKKIASVIFMISIDSVTYSVRNKAKVINYAIIYGMTPFSLAQELRITVDQAKFYMRQYFEKFPEIMSYINDVIVLSKKLGFVKNILGRKFFLSCSDRKSFISQSFFTKFVMNICVQSVVSDMIKIAMIKLNQLFVKQDIKARMLLQIHDSIIFDVPKSEVKYISYILRTVMKNVVDINELQILISIKVGNNWQEIS